MTEHQGIAAGIVAYLMLTLVVPISYHRLSVGSWPLTFHRTPDAAQRLLGAQLALLFCAGLAWAALLLGLGPERLGLWPSTMGLRATGWALLTAGAVIELGGQLSMGASFRVGIDTAPTALVTGGLFSLVRNPVFSGLLLAVLGIALLTPSPWTIMGAGWTASLIMLQTRLEEQHLIRLHGAAYRDYACRVGRFLPAVGRIHG